MIEQRVAIVALASALFAPQVMSAQVASTVTAGGLTTNGPGELPLNVLEFAPGVRYENPNVRIAARGSAWLTDQQWQVADGMVTGTLISPTIYGVRAELISNASRAFDDRARGNDQVDVETRVNVPFNRWGGMWLGSGVAHPWRVAVISSVDIADAGVWTQFGNTRISTTYTNFSLSKSGAILDTASTTSSCATSAGCRSQSRFSDLVGALHWAGGPLELDAQSGYRFGSSADVTPDTREWTSGTATIWLNERMAFVAGGGREPANPSRGLPARDFGTAGFMLAYWPIPKGVVPVAPVITTLVRGFEVRSISGGMERIAIRVGGVEQVEVMGDFTDWNALSLTRLGRDQWELTVPMAPGVHHINLRVDGGPWVAPPGLPTFRDSFSGDVGVLIVR